MNAQKFAPSRSLFAEHPATVERRNLGRPRALAIITDETRRGSVRIAAVFVVHRWDPLSACIVEEARDGTAHVLPFARMLRRGSRPQERRDRIGVFVFRRTEEAQSAAPTVAGKAAR